MKFYEIYTCRHSAALRKLDRQSCDTCTSPLYMNSSSAAILDADVPSRITSRFWCSGAVSKRSARCLLHAARISLWALKETPSQNSVTSASVSLLNKLLNDVARLLPKLFHFKQNCCAPDSMPPFMKLLAATTKKQEFKLNPELQIQDSDWNVSSWPCARSPKKATALRTKTLRWIWLEICVRCVSERPQVIVTCRRGAWNSTGILGICKARQ